MNEAMRKAFEDWVQSVAPKLTSLERSIARSAWQAAWEASRTEQIKRDAETSRSEGRRIDALNDNAALSAISVGDEIARQLLAQLEADKP